MKKFELFFLLGAILLVFGVCVYEYGKDRHYVFQVTHRVHFSPMLNKMIVNGHEYPILMRIPQKQDYYVPYPTVLEIKEREKLHIVLEIEGVDKQYTQCHVHFYQKANANLCLLWVTYLGDRLNCACDYDDSEH